LQLITARDNTDNLIALAFGLLMVAMVI